MLSPNCTKSSQEAVRKLDNTNTPPEGVVLWIAVHWPVRHHPYLELRTIGKEVSMFETGAYRIPASQLFNLSRIERLAAIAFTGKNQTAWLERREIKGLSGF